MSTFLTGVLSPTVFALDGLLSLIDLSRDQIESRLSEHAFRETNESLDALSPNDVRMGWVAGFSELPEFGILEHWSLEEGCIFVRLVVAEKKINNKERKRRVNVLLEAYRKEYKVKKVDRSVKKEIEEQVTNDLASKTTATTRVIGVVWDGSRVTIDSQAGWAVTAVRKFFRSTFGHNLRQQSWLDFVDPSVKESASAVSLDTFASTTMDRLWSEKADVKVWSTHVGQDVSICARYSAILSWADKKVVISSDDAIPESEVVAAKGENKQFRELGFHLVSADDVNIRGAVRFPDLGLKALKFPELIGEDEGPQGTLIYRMDLLEQTLSAVTGLATLYL